MSVKLLAIKESAFPRIEKEMKEAHKLHDFNDSFWYEFLSYCEDAMNEQGGEPFYEVGANDSATGHTRLISFELDDFEHQTIEADE